MIRNLTVTRNVFRTRGCIGKNRSEQIIGAHALNLWRNFFPVLKTKQRQRPVGVPAPARGKDRRIEGGLFQYRLDCGGLQEVENIPQREAMLLGQSDVQTVVRGRSLQLKVEANAETLAQSQSPRFVDASPKRRMDHQLHAAAFVEETLRNYCRLGGDRAQYRPALQDVFNRLLRAGILESTFFLQPRNCGCDIRLRCRET